MTAMSARSLHHLLKTADEVLTLTYRVPAGAINVTLVTLYQAMSMGLEGVEVTWTVVRTSNPDLIVCHTEDEALAHRTYADEIELARKAQSERVMSRR